MGNPALFPFFNASRSNDVIVVQINPVFRRGAPKSAREIYTRVTEITFTASLLREFRAIDFVSRLPDEGNPARETSKQVRPEARRVGKECVSTCRSGWSRQH